MKRLVLLAIIFAINLIAGKSYSQPVVSFYSFGSAGYVRSDLKLKDKLGDGYGASWDINSVIGVGFQHKHREVCELIRSDNAVTYFNTLSGEFYFHDNIKMGKSGKWFVYPKVGFLVGLGNPIKEKSQTQSLYRIKKDLELRDRYYLGGVLLEMDFGFNLSPRFSLATYARDEGLGGLVTNRPIVIENGYSIGSVSLGIKLFFKLSHSTTLMHPLNALWKKSHRNVGLFIFT